MSDVKVCKVMTSYGTTLVVLVPNSSNYNALTSAIEKKHANLYKIAGEVRVPDGWIFTRKRRRCRHWRFISSRRRVFSFDLVQLILVH